MNRHYYSSNDLKDLENVEKELLTNGISEPQIHVYSPRNRGAEVEAHQLHEIADFNRSNIIHSSIKGFLWGAVAAVAVLALANFLGWVNGPAGWMPFIFLAIVVFGFTAWEAGLQGIQTPNHKFSRFESAIQQGKHILFVDTHDNQEEALAMIVAKHPNLTFIGDGEAAPAWLVESQNQLVRFVKAMP